MYEQLSRADRLLLLKFVCGFAWTDLEIRDAERRFVQRLMDRLELDAEDRAEVDGWLHIAPAPDSLSPAAIPTEHRRTFVEAIRALIYVDGAVDPEEREQFERLKAALG
jgi:uncharacterized tellurite resistance protein B-like protein